MVYISLLRGINVSGKNLIKMEALRALYESLGLMEVSTYLQSGNVTFNSGEKDTAKLAKKIVAEIKKTFGYDVPVQILTVEKLKEVIKNNPFVKDKQKDPLFFHVTLLASLPADYDQAAIEAKKLSGEAIAFGKGVIYLYCPDGYGKTKLTNNFIESRLKVEATTRNWKTINALIN